MYYACVHGNLGHFSQFMKIRIIMIPLIILFYEDVQNSDQEPEYSPAMLRVKFSPSPSMSVQLTTVLFTSLPAMKTRVAVRLAPSLTVRFASGLGVKPICVSPTPSERRYVASYLEIDRESKGPSLKLYSMVREL